MPNQVRFTQLVKASGRPHSATLWLADPAKDPGFKRAIDENRIVTIHHVNVGAKKESGEIGFVKGGGAGYLIFPKSLPLAKGVRVMDLKFDILEEPAVKDPVKIKPALEHPKIEHAKTIETEEPQAAKTELSASATTASKKPATPKRKIKKNGATLFAVTVEFAATASREFAVKANSASAAIDAALNKGKKSLPKPNWQMEATNVKRQV